jgi:hypothetical protein
MDIDYVVCYAPKKFHLKIWHYVIYVRMQKKK